MSQRDRLPRLHFSLKSGNPLVVEVLRETARGYAGEPILTFGWSHNLTCIVGAVINPRSHEQYGCAPSLLSSNHLPSWLFPCEKGSRPGKTAIREFQVLRHEIVRCSSLTDTGKGVSGLQKQATKVSGPSRDFLLAPVASHIIADLQSWTGRTALIQIGILLDHI